MKLENWSRGYEVAKVLVGQVHRLIHSTIVVTGKENIPKDKPVILTPNHQNALLDALAVLLTIPYQPVWLARADIFNKKTKGILHFLKISPVYRMRDGMENLQKNQEVFDQAIRVLESRKKLALFPEGTHSGKRQSLAHKKAVPRIAFMAAEKHNFQLDIQIVPVGIYYSHYNKLNRYLMVQFGKPIALSKYQRLYEENANQAMMELRKDIYENVIPLTIHIPSKEFYDEYDLIMQVVDKPLAKDKAVKLCKPMDKFKLDQEIIQNIEDLNTHDSEAYKLLMEQSKQYLKFLKLENLTDNAIEKGKVGFFEGLLQMIKFVLLFPIALYGGILHFIPFTLPSSLIRKKIKDTAFWGTFEFVVNLILIPLMYIIYAIVVALVFKSIWITLGFLITLPFMGKLAYLIQQNWLQFTARIRFGRSGKRKEISNLRKAIQEMFFHQKKIVDSVS